MVTATDIKTERQVGLIVRRRPGVTRWVAHDWRPVGVLPDAGPVSWRLLREENGVAEFHAATLPLTLWRGETEAYRVALSEPVPCLYAVLRPSGDRAFPFAPHLLTASPHEAQLFAQSGEEIVEKIALPDTLRDWIGAWIARHHEDLPFVKRKRRPHHDDRPEDGIGDPRISQATDVYRAPTAGRHGGGA